jgi:L-malate glycosyltransferase
MRILYFTREYTTHDYRFLSALSKSGLEVFYLQLEERGHSLEGRALPKGIKTLKFGDIDHRSEIFRVLDLQRLIAEIHPDLILAGPLHLSAYLAAYSGFQPLVSMSWGYDLLYDAQRRTEWRQAIQYTLDHSTLMIGDCNTIRQHAISYGMPDERIVTFPWGIDLEHFKTLRVSSTGNDGTFKVLSTRGWEPIYGVDVIARGFVQAAQQRRELRLVMLGNGSQASLLRTIFSDGGVLEKVQFPGQVGQAELPDYYRSADIYLSASHSDGTSISLLEALACGKPALVSDIPGNREWIEPGVQGWWFSDGDANALATALVNAVDQRRCLPEMGKAARALAEQRADWNKNFPELLKAFDLALRLSNKPRN